MVSLTKSLPIFSFLRANSWFLGFFVLFLVSMSLISPLVLMISFHLLLLGLLFLVFVRPWIVWLSCSLDFFLYCMYVEYLYIHTCEGMCTETRCQHCFFFCCLYLIFFWDWFLSDFIVLARLEGHQTEQALPASTPLAQDLPMTASVSRFYVYTGASELRFSCLQSKPLFH